jgi:hypothetical protein
LSDKRTCENCRFFELVEDIFGNDQGVCRMNPPTWTGERWEQPQVFVDDRCGEYKP